MHEPLVGGINKLHMYSTVEIGCWKVTTVKVLVMYIQSDNSGQMLHM